VLENRGIVDSCEYNQDNEKTDFFKMDDFAEFGINLQ
jgi:hypothetical protein